MLNTRHDIPSAWRSLNAQPNCVRETHNNKILLKNRQPDKKNYKEDRSRHNALTSDHNVTRPRKAASQRRWVSPPSRDTLSYSFNKIIVAVTCRRCLLLLTTVMRVYRLLITKATNMRWYQQPESEAKIFIQSAARSIQHQCVVRVDTYTARIVLCECQKTIKTQEVIV